MVEWTLHDGRNAYMAEPGVIPCSMMESTSTSIRQKAMETINKLKTKPPKKPQMIILAVGCFLLG